MNYVSPNGFQFRFSAIKDPSDCSFKHFYTSNISLEKSWLEQDLFDEDFPYGAMEDTELSYRLKKKGLRIAYNDKAIGYHCHQITVESFCERMRLTGISSAICIKKHPELRPALLPIKPCLARPIFSLPVRARMLERMNKRLFWFLKIVDSYLRGAEEGLK